MLEEFSVDNFKSLINVTFRPRAQNLLIGMNNSGKTNLCQALRFLASTVELSLPDCVLQTAGGNLALTNYYFTKPTIDFRVRARVPFGEESILFDYALTIIGKRAPFSAGVEVQAESLRCAALGHEDILLLERSRDSGRLLQEPDLFKGEVSYLPISVPADVTLLSRVFDFKNHLLSTVFRDYIGRWQYYSLSPLALRKAEYVPNTTVLSAAGDNLASVLFHLKTGDERKYRELLEHLKRLDPTIELINFWGPMENLIVMVLENATRKTLDASAASDGTLRFLALIYVLLVQPGLASSPLIIIEEPENGLYVGVLRELLQMVSAGAAGAQTIFTSHAPYFIDLFDNQLDGIFLLKRGDRHSSIVQPDVTKIKARLEKYPLGEQHFREMLG